VTRWGRALSAGMALFGAALFAASYRFARPLDISREVGPAFAPRLFALVLIALAVAALLRPGAVHGHARGRPDAVTWLAAALFAAYVLALPRLGYVVSTPAMLALLLTLLRAGRWPAVAAFSVGMTLFGYLVFDRLLTIGLPAGPWGF
jgi:putative tricarboxylic transport membrane protein